MRNANGLFEQYGRLFDQRHALLNDIQNPNVCQDHLEACSRHILRAGWSLGTDLRTYVRHMSLSSAYMKIVWDLGGGVLALFEIVRGYHTGY